MALYINDREATQTGVANPKCRNLGADAGCRLQDDGRAIGHHAIVGSRHQFRSVDGRHEQANIQSNYAAVQDVAKPAAQPAAETVSSTSM